MLATSSLTAREREVARLVAQGLTNRRLAERLNIREGTVKVHLNNIFRKAAVPNRAALAALVSQAAQVEIPRSMPPTRPSRAKAP